MDINKERWSFGRRLSIAMAKVKTTNKELAELIGVHPNTIIFWKNDAKEPGINKVKQAAHFLDCDLAWLITGFDTYELQALKSNREITAAVRESGPTYIIERNADLVNKLLKLSDENKVLIEGMIDGFLKLEGK